MTYFHGNEALVSTCYLQGTVGWMVPTECLMRKLMISDTTLDSVKLDATPLPCHVKLDINGVFLSW